MTSRRRPRFSRWILTGFVLGFVLGMALAVLTPQNPIGYSQSAAVGFMGMTFGLLGGVLAAVAAVLVDPTPRPPKATRRPRTQSQLPAHDRD